MTIQFLPHLVNDPFGDPAVYLQIRHEKMAVLFDLGELDNLPTRKLMKIAYVFVSHCHIDHFIGFDRLLRCVLGRPKTIHFFGPAGFLGHVRGKLAGYTWNLVGSYPLELRATEILPDRLRHTTFFCRDGFRERPVTESDRNDDLVLQLPAFTVRAAIVDHKIPCAAYRLEEPFHINFRREILQREDWPRGPWLTKLRRAIRDGVAATSRFRVGDRDYSVGELRRRLTITTPGQVIGYASDFNSGTDNMTKLIRLLRNCDILFCEAAFLENDRERAAFTDHLTAVQAATLAREVGAKRLVLFHFSPKNHGRAADYYREASRIFRGQLG